MDNKVRVRFAPSPTGDLHLGGARTALFNWLFARHNKGVFLLRIEDTDLERSTKEAVEVILKGLRWLGMDWDEGPDKGGDYGPYFQAERKDIYKKYAERLLTEKKAYTCYCSPEELEKKRESALSSGKPPKYDGRCRDMSDEEKKKCIAEGRKYVVRFRSRQEGLTKIDDLIRGEVVFDNALLDDFVILKSSGIATYNFAVVVDDIEMKISHVIRGDDHISNTPRQILLYEALGAKLPGFAHIPMIYRSDRKKLSKRHGAVAVTAYEQQGYLSEAMVNYLSLLGWSTSDSQQLFRLDDLVGKFSLEGCSKSPSIFDFQKLEWMNGEYIRSMNIDELALRAEPFVEASGLEVKDRERLKKAISMEQEKIKLLKDIPGLIDFMFKEEIDYEEGVKEKVLSKEGVKEILEGMRDAIRNMKDFNEQELETIIRKYCEDKGIKTSMVFHPLRVAVSGRTKGPGLFVMMGFIGREKVLERIENSLKYLGSSPFCVGKFNSI